MPKTHLILRKWALEDTAEHSTIARIAYSDNSGVYSEKMLAR